MANNGANDSANGGTNEANAAANMMSTKGETLGDIAAFAGRIGSAGRLIGIDAGTKTLGLALSDVTRTIASPLVVLRRKRFKEDAAELLRLVHEHGVAGLVLGLPTNLDGTTGPRVQATRAF